MRNTDSMPDVWTVHTGSDTPVSRWMSIKVLLLPLLLGLAAQPVRAGEGMWTPDQLPRLGEALRQTGLTAPGGLPLEVLADIKQGPAGAVVSVGGGTGTFVSRQGLIITNHHVAYDAIQLNSSEGADYLADGFLAANFGAELRAPGYEALLLLASQDVTDTLRAELQAESRTSPGAASGQADAASGQAGTTNNAEPPQTPASRLTQARRSLEKACETEPGIRCEVVGMDYGHRYVLERYRVFQDIRLVYAPSAWIGDFGGEIDNFMFPRHSGDFALLRAYVDPSGKSATYSKDNVPFQPERFLTFSSTPIGEKDPIMVFGYPWHTARHMPGTWMAWQATSLTDAMITRLSARMRILQEASASNRERAIRLASDIANLGNALTSYERARGVFQKTHPHTARLAFDARLSAWIAADPARTARYGQILPELNARIALQEQRWQRSRTLEDLYRSTSLLALADALLTQATERRKPEGTRSPGYSDGELAMHRMWQEDKQHNLDLPLEQTFLTRGLEEALALPADAALQSVLSRYPGRTLQDRQKKVAPDVAKLLKRTRLTQLDARLALFDGDPQAILSSQDPLLQLARSLKVERSAEQQASEELQGQLEVLLPLYQEAAQAMEGRLVAPDANGTLRVTFGRVEGYSPGDAIWHHAFTTLGGVLEKDRGAPPFQLPEALKRAAVGHETLPVNFVATVDTTGGNSGSAVLNARGELVGLIFDGNAEGTGDELVFWEQRQRSVCIDARYMGFLLGRVAGAQSLLNELGFPSSLLVTP